MGDPYFYQESPPNYWYCVSPVLGKGPALIFPLLEDGTQIALHSFIHSLSRTSIYLTMINWVYFAPGTGLIAGDTDGDWRKKWVVARHTIPKPCGPYTVCGKSHIIASE